jgi:succinoglycan biosynthesis transport protein ExoP
MVDSAAIPPSNEPEFGYGQLFQILLRRWPWFAGALGLSLAGAVYVSLQEEPIYESSMQLIVEPNFEEDFRLSDAYASVEGASASEADYATQLTLMRSDQFLIEASQRLQDVYPELTLGAIKPQFNLVRVVPDGSKSATRIFEAQFIFDDPIKTQRFLEELQDVYTEYNIQQQQQRLTRGLAQVDEQLAETEASLRSAQSSLRGFRQQQDLIDPTRQGQVILDSLNQVQAEQRQLLNELSALEARNQELLAQLQLSPQSGLVASRLSQSGRVQGLLNTLQETALQLAERQILFTDQDPTTQVLAAQQDNQRDLLRQEMSYILREPVQTLDPELLSYIQLGSVDTNLVAELVELEASLSALEAQANSLIELEAVLRQDLERFPGLIAEYDRLQPDVDIQRSALQRLLEQREQLTAELARGGFTWEIVEPPRLGRQIGPNRNRNLMLGAVVGLFLGGLLAFVRESTDNVLHTSDDLKRRLPVPLLGILPRQADAGLFSFGSGRRDSTPPMLHPELAESELIQTVTDPGYREATDLMTNSLQLRSGDKSQKVFAITSGLPGEGKTTVALGLSLSLARMNQRVLLIDADLRRSGLQAQLGIESEAGLSTLLRGLPVDTRPQRLDLGYVKLDVLPAGPVPDDPITLLSSPRFSRLLARGRELYDVILIDTPPVLGMADAIKVGSVCDGTLVVSRLDRITQSELTEVLSLLAPLKVLGVIANGAKLAPNRYAYGALPEPQKTTSRR